MYDERCTMNDVRCTMSLSTLNCQLSTERSDNFYNFDNYKKVKLAKLK